MRISTPDLYDAHKDHVQVAKNTLKHFGATTSFMGQAVTAVCPNDNSMVAALLKDDGTNKILVVDAGANQDFAFLGDKMAALAIKNHWQGVIVDACVRDIEILATMPLGVMALGATPRCTEKKGHGTTNSPIYCQGVLITPGDYLYADTNGLLISKKPLF